MHVWKRVAGVLLVLSLALGGCIGGQKENNQPPASNGDGGGAEPEQNLALVEPMESALIALLGMNETGREKKFTESEEYFLTFREHWAKIRVELNKYDPKLEQHIEDGAIELDIEFKKPLEEIRVYELDEETVKLGRLLSKAADLMNVPIRQELVQVDPTMDIPFNEEMRIEITLSDHKFEPAFIEVPQHTRVTFVLKNVGKEVHEFEIGHYAVEVEDIQPGETHELTVTLLDAGDWEISCHLPGHYEVGMHGMLRVTPAELKPQN